MINGFVGVTMPGWLHTASATVGIVVGAEQLLRTRRDRLHRVLGYVYVFAMAAADVAALTIYRFNGSFNPFHAAALVNLGCLVLAIIPMLRTPRPPNWKLTHYMWICWSYVGLLAAAATEFIIRTQPIGSMGGTIVATVVATTAVGLIGAFAIRRNAPRERTTLQSG